uniref:RING-type domain-containing protein n=1 Tax=Skeletonema marinoi TaxID=267567 RepID=A0A6U3VVT3_9STRA|mmetsp:Transcript_24110/g.41034  ORF Transcript_24110/g.41034 Transcript_24110/m.41034 type:complete len:883 (+) Transcript_24110:203-2851(+)
MTMQQQTSCIRRRTKLLLFYAILTSILSSSSAGLLDGSVDQEDINDDDSHNNESSSSSHNWWKSMFQGLQGQINIAQPANRRGHSSTYFIDKHDTEWMIVSGGFTDEDWHSMPVWAYDLTSGKEMEQYNEMTVEEQNEYAWNVDKMELYEHPWVSMNFRSGDHEQPQGRVGHLSSTYNDCLYIFGGLTYNFGFSVEYPDNGYNSLVVWKGCGLDHYLKKREGLVWEKIVPTVHGEYPVEPEESSGESNNSNSNGSDDMNASSSNTTAEEGGDNSGNSHGHASSGNTTSEEEEVGVNSTSIHDHESSDNTKSEVEGGDGRLRRNLLPTSTDGLIITNNNKKRNDGEQEQKTTLKKPTINISILPRGELQGGHYAPQDDDKEYFIFHGGVIQGDLETTGEVALGDVWKYDYEDNALTLLAPYPPLQWQHDERNQLYPMARTAHAATVVGDELIIHGGMHPSEDILDEMSSSVFSSPSDSYAAYKTHAKWKPLTDVWVFNLKTLKWKERIQFPQMARSYHTLVGSDDGQIAAFGGFQQDTSQYSSETVVFVFKDLLISRPDEMYWLKLMPSADQISHSLVRQSYRNNYLLGITNRLEHSAILDKSGSMFVWGGRFQTVNQITGLWRLDVFTEDANLHLEVAPPDGIEAYEKELEALHLFLVTMMFMSLTISSLLSSMRRRGEDQEIIERSSHRRGGLSQDVIDSLPTKRYEAPRRSVTDDGDVVEDVSLSRENSVEESDLHLEMNRDCCAICLADYEEGVSEIRTLPCGHAFDKECIDSWFEAHTTCPACRQGIENTPLSPSSEANSTRSGSIIFSSWLSPSTGIWSPIGDSIPEAATSDTSNDYDGDNVGVHVADSRRRGLFRLFTRRVHEPIPAPTLNEFELV